MRQLKKTTETLQSKISNNHKEVTGFYQWDIASYSQQDWLPDCIHKLYWCIAQIPLN